MDEIQKTRQDIDKWYSSSTIVDVKTGEVLKKMDKDKYIVINKTKTYEFTEQIKRGRVYKYGHIQWTTEVGRNPQSSLFD